MMLAMLLTTFTVAIAQTTDDDIITLPDGLTPETWYGSGLYWYYDNMWTALEIDGNEEFSFQVAFDGNDVYVAGLNVFYPEFWAKGTITGNTIVFKSGQVVGKDTNSAGEERTFYLTGSESAPPFGVDKDIIFTYDAEAGKMTANSAADVSLVPDFSGNLYYYLAPFSLQKETILPLSEVTPPAGMQTEEYKFEGKSLAFSTNDVVVGDTPFTVTVQVGFDGNDVYVQGLNKDYAPEVWVKGTREGNTITFKQPQLFGSYWVGSTENIMYFMGIDPTTNDMCDLTMTYDEATGTMTGDCWLSVNAFRGFFSYYQVFDQMVLTKEANGISNQVADDTNNADYFDIAGRRTQPTAKGLIIQHSKSNGKAIKRTK